MSNTSIFHDFNGILDAAGTGTAQFNTLGLLAPVCVGVDFWFAYLLYYPLDYVSNAVRIRIVP